MNTSSAPQVRRILAWLAAASVPVLLFPDVISRASRLATATQLSPADMALAWGVMPIVGLSGLILVMAPGLLASIALGRSRTVDQWILDGFILSLVGVSVLSGAMQALVGGMLRGRAYAAFLFVLTALCGAWAMRRARLRQREQLPQLNPRSIGLVLALVWVVTVLLVPKLLWESFNGDGAHAWESSRRLLYHALPFWPPEAGAVAGFPGLTTMLYAFPNGWFLRLFGEVDVAARLPFLLYMVVLWSALRRLGSTLVPSVATSRAVDLGMVLSLLAYLLAMAFSTSYSPYNADLALPATQDTLLMIVFIATLVAAAELDTLWLLICTFLSYVSLPSGTLLLAFWFAARVLVERPVPWRNVFTGAATLAVAMVTAAVLGRVAVALGSAPPGGEYGLAGILQYFAFVQFTDWHRLLYAAIPAGILPALVLVAWRRQDPLARSLTILTAAYFAFFFVQAHVSLHHFVPAMVIPIAVALRVGRSNPDMLLVRSWPVLGSVAVLLAFPWGRTEIHRDGREVGSHVLVLIEGYERAEAEPMRATTTLDRLFPYDWKPAVPGSYGGSPLVWNHYAQHGGNPGALINYIVQASAAPAPTDFRLLGSDSTGAAVLVRSDSILAMDRARRPATPAGSRILDVPRGVLFHGVPLSEGPRIFDTAQLLKSWGLDPDPILRRLGVHRESES